MVQVEDDTHAMCGLLRRDCGKETDFLGIVVTGEWTVFFAVSPDQTDEWGRGRVLIVEHDQRTCSYEVDFT